MPLSVALEDDGLFIMSSYFNGVSHPPGYPLHSLIGKLFTLLPIGTVAARVHAVSAVFGALSCVMLWLLIRDILNSKVMAYAGAFSLAFSTTFWSQAIIAEVYTLNTFFLFALLYLMQLISNLAVDNSSCNLNRLTYFSAFIFGLSLCNHWPLMLLSSPGLLVLVWPRIKSDPLVLFKSMPFIALGLLPYAWMVFNSHTSPVISFTGSIDSWQEFTKFISRSRYVSVDSSASAGFADKLDFLYFYLRELASQFYYVGIVLVVLGIYAQFKYFQKFFIASLFLIFLGNSLILILLLDFDFDLINRSVISVYFLVSYGISCIWFSVGLFHCYKSLPATRIPPQLSDRVIILACTLHLSILFAFSLSSNFRHNYDWGESYANTVLNSLPENAVVILHDDISMGTIGYTHLVELVRPDIKLLSDKSVVFNDRLYDPALLAYDNALPIINDYIKQETRFVYTTSPDTSFYQNDHWLTRSYSKNIPEGQHVMHIPSLDKTYLDYVYLQSDSGDVWTNIHRKQLLTASVPFVLESMLRGDDDPIFDKIIKYAMNDLGATLSLIHYLKARGSLAVLGGLEQLLPHAEGLYLASTEKIPRADYLRFRALLSKQDNDSQSFEQYIVDSIDEWPNIDNMSFAILSQIYMADGRANEYNQFIQKFDPLIVEKYTLR